MEMLIPTTAAGGDDMNSKSKIVAVDAEAEI